MTDDWWSNTKQTSSGPQHIIPYTYTSIPRNHHLLALTQRNIFWQAFSCVFLIRGSLTQ